MTEIVESPDTYTPDSVSPAADQMTHGQACACHEHHLSDSLVARGLAEFVGTFFVILVVIGVSSWSLISQGQGGSLLSAALAAVFAYGAAASIFGQVSGGHFNPAVTLAAALASKISWLDALIYFIAQIVASIAAGATVYGLLHLIPDITTQSGSLPNKFWWTETVNGFGKNAVLGISYGVDLNVAFAIVVEFIGSLIVISAVVRALRSNGSPRKGFVLATGLAYGAATFLTFSITGAGLNPARSTGIAIFAKVSGQMPEAIGQLWIFWVVPLLAGAIVGTVLALARTIGKANGEYDIPLGSTPAGLPEQQDTTGFDLSIETQDPLTVPSEVQSDPLAEPSEPATATTETETEQPTAPAPASAESSADTDKAE